MTTTILDSFQLADKKALVTGGTGFLGGAIARALAEAGAEVFIAGRNKDTGNIAAKAMQQDHLAVEYVQLDVTSKSNLEDVASTTGALDILVNGAGGNLPGATASEENSFFDIPLDAMEKVVGLNFFGGALLPCQVFGKAMAENPKGGVILNVSSMCAFQPLTRVVGYSASKAAVNNFTQWLAVHLAQEYSPGLRVNAIAPGFFLTDQNRFLLTEKGTGNLTERGQTIVNHTPMGRFGNPEDLAGTALWLCSPASAFVTGIVAPVDGGFSAFSGV